IRRLEERARQLQAQVRENQAANENLRAKVDRLRHTGQGEVAPSQEALAEARRQLEALDAGTRKVRQVSERCGLPAANAELSGCATDRDAQLLILKGTYMTLSREAEGLKQERDRLRGRITGLVAALMSLGVVWVVTLLVAIFRR